MSDDEAKPPRRRGRQPKTETETGNTKSAKNKRPKEFSAEIGDRVCEQVADGCTITEIARDPAMPSRGTIRRWEADHPQFRVDLQIAFQHRADAHADKIAGLIDDLRSNQVDPHATRVAIDGLRWLASKGNAQRYGDRTTQVLTGDGKSLGEELNAGSPAERDLEAARRVAFMLGRADRSLRPEPAQPPPVPEPRIIDVTPAPAAIELKPAEPEPPPQPQARPSFTQIEQQRMHANRDMSRYLEQANRAYERPARQTSYKRRVSGPRLS